MKSINFKNIKELGNKLFYNSLYENNEFAYKDFIKDIKESPVLRTQYIVYTNIENNKFDNKDTASFFLKENFDLFKQFTKEQILDANKELTNKYFSKMELNEGEDKIFDLITESTNNKKVNYKKKAELFSSLLNDITEETVITESEGDKIEFNKNIPIKKVIKRASEIINEKYSFFDDTEKEILKSFVNKDNKSKENIYKSLIKENTNLLKRKLIESDSDEEIYDKLKLTEDKLKSLSFTPQINIAEFNKLLELKKSLK